MPEPYLQPKAVAKGCKFPLTWPEEPAFGMPGAPLGVSQAPEQVVVLQRETAMGAPLARAVAP